MSRHRPSSAPPSSGEPILLIQKIETHWSKASRGGAGAARRNEVPETLPLPDLPPWTEPVTLLHCAAFSEFQGFAAPPVGTFTITADIQKVRLHSLSLYPTPPTIRVALEWTAGAPYRFPVPRVAELAPEGWVQIRYNHRVGLEYGWSYHKYVFNVGYFSAPAQDVFIATPPRLIKSLLADLW